MPVPSGSGLLGWLAVVLGSGGFVALLGVLVKLWVARVGRRKREAEARKCEAETRLIDLQAQQLREQLVQGRTLESGGGSAARPNALGSRNAGQILNLIQALGYPGRLSLAQPAIAFGIQSGDDVLPAHITLKGPRGFCLSAAVARVKKSHLRKEWAIGLLEDIHKFEHCQVSLRPDTGGHTVVVSYWGDFLVDSGASEAVSVAIDQIKAAAGVLLDSLHRKRIPFAMCQVSA